jgi:hypothetical protein
MGLWGFPSASNHKWDKSMKRNKLAITVLFAFSVMAGPVLAVPDFTATVSGAIAASDGRPENATADFTFNNTFSSLSLTLTNTAGAGQLGGISSILDGISFELSGVSSNALSLSSVSNPNGTVACTKSGGCTFNSAPVSLATSNWTYNSATHLLAAGAGSFKPYGIANNNISVSDGIPNGQHNPYLNGPVTFVFSITNPNQTSLSLTSANFYFGTAPDIQTGTIESFVVSSIPEPESYALMLAGLGLLGFIGRHRKQDHV